MDYLVYIPLFLSMHDGICLNPLDMSQKKYIKENRPITRETTSRDLNPLGFPLKRRTSFQVKQHAFDIVEGKKIDHDEARQKNKEILEKYARSVFF